MVEILTFTQPNPALKAGKAKHGSDVPQIWQGRSTFCRQLNGVCRTSLLREYRAYGHFPILHFRQGQGRARGHY